MSPTTEPDIFKIYDRFGNLFRLSYETGKLYLIPPEISEEIGEEKTIFLNGAYFSYEHKRGAEEVQPNMLMIKKMITKQFKLKLKAEGYGFSRGYIAYFRHKEVEHPHRDIFSIFDGFEFRIVSLNDIVMLCINPHLVIKTNCSIKHLIEEGLSIDKLKDFSVRYTGEEGWRIDGYLIETIVESKRFLCRIKNYREFKEEIALAETVYPEPKPELIQHFLGLLHRDFDIVTKQRELSFLDSKTASKDRFYKTLEIINTLKKNVFPMNFGDWKIDLETTPIVIKL